MAHTYLLFDFGTNEDAAQQARHKVEGWKQAFRLDKKLLVKFDRGGSEPGGVEGASKSSKSAKEDKPRAKPVKLIVRLDFSDHEKLSHQRWTERIPSEGLFRDAQPKVVKQGDPEFAPTAERFDELS